MQVNETNSVAATNSTTDVNMIHPIIKDSVEPKQNLDANITSTNTKSHLGQKLDIRV